MPPFFQQLRSFLQQFSVGQRIALFTVVIGILSALIVLSIWANQPEYSLLYSDLAPEDANRAISALRDDGVPYRLGASGTAIYVPAEKVTEYRLSFAASGLATGSITGYELFDDQRMGMTTFMQRVNYQRALEGELTQTIAQMDEVRTARVHLVIPEKRLFEDKDGSSASVVLHLEPGAFLRPRQIKGIAMMIANSVPGLLANNVSIVDAGGTLLSDALQDGEGAPIGSGNWEITRSVEIELQKKAQELLDDVLGSGRSRVKVSADLNFEQLERTREFYDTEDAAVLSEETNSEYFTGADTSNRRVEQAVTNYELNKTVEHFVASSGEVRRLTVAVLVDGKYSRPPGAAETEVASYEPRIQQELDQIQALMVTALGLDLERGDLIEVQNMQFDRVLEMAEEATMRTAERGEFWKKLAANAIIGIALIIGLFYLFKILRTTASAINITQLLPGAIGGIGGIGEEGVLIGGTEGLAAVVGGPPPPGALEAAGEMEMVTDTFMQKLSPEARAQLEAHDKMTGEVTSFTEESPEAAAQLLRIWTSGGSVG